MFAPNSFPTRLLRTLQPKIMPWQLAVALIALILVVGSLVIVTRIELNNAPELYFPHDAPATVLERELREEFPDDEILVALFAAPDIYAADTLRAIEQVASEMAALDDVDRVLSATRADHVAGTADGFVVEPLIDLARLDASSADERRARVLADRFMPGWLAAEDGSALALIVRTNNLTESRQRQAIEDALHAAVARAGLDQELVAVAGTVALDAAEMRSMIRDTLIFTPIVMALGLALLYWVVGSLVPVIVGGIAMSTVTTVTLALLVAFKLPYTLVSAMLPTLLTAYTASNLLHLYAAIRRARDAGVPAYERERRAIEYIHVPAFFNVLSTAAGMASLVLVPIPPIQVFGLMGALGTLIIYFVVLYLVPPLLARFDTRPWPQDSGGFKWTHRISWAFARFGMRRAGWVALTVVALFLLALPTALKVEAESDLLKFFKPDHPLSVSTERIERDLSGVTALEIVVDGSGRDAFKSVDTLTAIQRVQRGVEALPEVDRSLSMMDIVEEMNWAFNEEDPAFRRLPANDRALAQLLLIYDGRDLQEMVNGEFQRMRILLSLNVHGANAIEAVIDDIEQVIAQAGVPAELHWQMGGYGRLFADQEDLLVVGQLHSFLGAFGQIFLIMLLLWRSLPAAIIGMLPNLAPLFFVFTLMGGFGIHLDMATVLIAGVVLGITVDDTIHLFHGYLGRRLRGHSVVFSLARSFEASGRAVLAISLLLVCQFMLLATSNFVPTIHFGMLTAIGLLAGQLMELFMLPALLVMWGRLGFRHPMLRV